MTSGPYGDGPTAPNPYGDGASYPAAAPGPVPPPAYPPPSYESQSVHGHGYGAQGYRNAGYSQPGYPGHGAPQRTYGPAGAAPIGYGAYPAPRNGLGTASLVLGIIGVVFCWVPFTGWALNILAIIFGAVGRKRAADGLATNKSSAVAGLVLGVIGLGVWIVIIVVFVSAVGTIGVGVDSIGS
jgi:hypothetical protein